MDLKNTLGSLTLILLFSGLISAQDAFRSASISSALRAADGADVLVKGTVKGYPDSDEVILQDATGTILVDLEESHRRMGLPIGASIFVLGEVDRDGGIQIEADHVYRVGPNLSHGALQFRGVTDALILPDEQIIAVRGRVLTFYDTDEIILEDKSGSILIDLDNDHHLRLGIRPGDELTILGEVDADIHGRKEIDALVIRRNPAPRSKPSKKATTPARPATRTERRDRRPATPPAAAPKAAAPKAVTAPAPQQRKATIQDRLILLKKLYDQKLITQEEYAARKEAILKEI